MTSCHYCLGELGELDAWSHRRCHLEAVRRADAGKCTLCGGLVDRRGSNCAGCKGSSPPYAGYPPGEP